MQSFLPDSMDPDSHEKRKPVNPPCSRRFLLSILQGALYHKLQISQIKPALRMHRTIWLTEVC
jgi:hypothetical protein